MDLVRKDGGGECQLSQKLQGILLILRAPRVNFQNIMINNEPNLKINQILKPIHELTNKQIYLELVIRKANLYRNRA